MGFIVGLFIIVIIVSLQGISSKKVREEIESLKNFFPNINSLFLIDTVISKNILSDRESIKDFINNPPLDKEDKNLKENETKISLIKSKGGSVAFKEMIYETNEYLCKNAGTSADLSVLQDICEKKISVMENAIRTSLNLPLYLGLVGTFLGIIGGIFLFTKDLSSVFGVEPYKPAADTSGLENLLNGVGFAMIASLCGLGITIWNTNITYKHAVVKLDTQENEYFDFLRRELMPTLSNSMSASLNSLKGVLGHFVDKFGRNLNNYADSVHLLNDNLDKQHLVLQEIQEIGVTQMAKTIATSFAELKEAAESLNAFRMYQRGLNNTIEKVNENIYQADNLLKKFDKFLETLQIVADSQVDSNRLQHEFKDAINQHFPTGSEGREIWRKEFDNLLQDAQKVSKQLNSQLTQNTRYVEKFVNDNQHFFTSFNEIQSVISSLVEYAKIQGECYSDLKEEIASLRKDAIDSQKENAELHKSLLEAVKTMTKALKEKKN